MTAMGKTDNPPTPTPTPAATPDREMAEDGGQAGDVCRGRVAASRHVYCDGALIKKAETVK